MRATTIVSTLIIVLGWTLPTAAVAAEPVAELASFQDQGNQQQEGIEIEAIERTETETTVWYADPFWIAVGVIGALVVLILIVLAARGGGGGTTVIKEERGP